MPRHTNRAVNLVGGQVFRRLVVIAICAIGVMVVFLLVRSHDQAQLQRDVLLLNSTDDYEWLNAAHRLGRRGSELAIPYLIKGLRHRAWRGDEERIWYLRKITGQDFGSDFVRWKQWWESRHPGVAFDWVSYLGSPPRIAQIEREITGVDDKLQNATEYLERADSYREIRAWGRALSNYNAALELEPNNPDTYNLRGLTKNSLHDFKGAAEDFVSATRLSPATAQFWANLSMAYFRLGAFDEATASANRALALNQNNATALIARASVYLAINELALAEMDFARCAEMQPAFRTYYTSNSSSIDERAFCYKRLGDVRLKRGDRQGALKAFRAALRVSPEFTDARVALAIAEGRQAGASQDK
jgi:tetratricopeptide (TPR) repeat protein